jgi:cystathionine beta-lyase/cystathionine gamma-synthase
MKQATKVVHAGAVLDKFSKGVNSPIYTSTAHTFIDEDDCAYPRYYNTTAQAIVANKISALEQTEETLVFSSGMAAISSALLGLLKKGDHLVCQGNIYGGTRYFMESELPKLGIEVSFTDSEDNETFASLVKANTKLIYTESPSNPLLKVIDLTFIAGLARNNKAISMVDATFATPINLQASKLGIDLIMHSGTKYLGGHSDLIFGSLSGSKKIINEVHHAAVNYGGNLNGTTCGLIERSLKTLSVRIKQQNINAGYIAEKLSQADFTEAVYYPGLKNSPYYETAKSQMSGFGGMLSFEIKLNNEQIKTFMRSLNIILPAISLGGVESLMGCPRISSHAKVSAAARAEMGIKDNLMRFSVGIEDAEDLYKDIVQAYEQAIK